MTAEAILLANALAALTIARLSSPLDAVDPQRWERFASALYVFAAAFVLAAFVLAASASLGAAR